MPRDNDKDNDSRGRRDRPFGGKGRSGAARGPEKKFAKRAFSKSEGGKRPYAGGRDDRPPRRRDDDGAPRRDYGDRPRPARFDRDDRGRGEKRDFKPRGDRPRFDRDDRAPRAKRDYGDRNEARPAGRFQDRKFGDRKPYAARDRDGEKRPYAPRGPRKDFGDRPPRDGARTERKFGGDRKFSRGADRGPRKDFGDRPPHGESKPWQKREGGDRDERGSRPHFDKLYAMDMPRIETLAQAKHFILGPKAYAGAASPWARPITSWQRPESMNGAAAEPATPSPLRAVAK